MRRGGGVGDGDGLTFVMRLVDILEDDLVLEELKRWGFVVF